MRRLLLIVLLPAIVCLHVFTLEKAADAMKRLPRDEGELFVIPPRIFKIAVLEHQGLASDILFLESMVFIGGTQQRKEPSRVTEGEWNWLIKVLDLSTELDPYFFDPYYYANAFLPWDAGKVEEANRILAKGSRYRDWDWMLPFFIGFNDFYFLHNDAAAAEYLMEASRRPGGDPMFASIASRLAFKENRTETAIYFLEELAVRSDDDSVRKRFETRIQSLQYLLVVEKAVSLYKRKFGRVPANVDELVNGKILSKLPKDPYGGSYYLTKDGKVSITTSAKLAPYLSPLQKKSSQ